MNHGEPFLDNSYKGHCESSTLSSNYHKFFDYSRNTKSDQWSYFVTSIVPYYINSDSDYTEGCWQGSKGVIM